MGLTIFSIIIMGLVAIKAIIIGSDFSLHLLWKYGKEYYAWYSSRPDNTDFVREHKNMYEGQYCSAGKIYCRRFNNELGIPNGTPLCCLSKGINIELINLKECHNIKIQLPVNKGEDKKCQDKKD